MSHVDQLNKSLKPNGNYKYEISQVKYDYDEQKSLVKAFFLDDSKEIYLRNFLRDEYSTFKHPSFKYENEYRIIYSTINSVTSSDALTSEIEDENIKFDYSSSKGIYTFVEFPLVRNIIERIELGPRFDEFYQAVTLENKNSDDPFKKKVPRAYTDMIYFLYKYKNRGFGDIPILPCSNPYCG